MLSSWPTCWIFGTLSLTGFIALIELNELGLFAVVFWPILFIAWDEVKARDNKRG